MTTTLAGSAASADTTTPPRPWDEVETAIIAKALTTRSSEHILHVQPEADNQAKTANAREMRTRLQNHAERLVDACAGRPELHALMRAIDEEDHDLMATLGLDISYAWFDDILTALVSGAPFVEIETVGPYAANHLDSEGNLEVSADNLPDDERAGLLLAAILRDATTGRSNTRVAAHAVTPW